MLLGIGAEMDKCNCYFCFAGKEHRADHLTFKRVSSGLRVAESLDPADEIKLEACVLCGHSREAK